METIDYYNQYADEFAQATVHVDMGTLYQPFLITYSRGNFSISNYNHYYSKFLLIP